MKDILTTIYESNALVITAPPGWGKTYKLLEGIALSGKKVIFIFPLRALCDEVHESSVKFGIDALNIKRRSDLVQLNKKIPQLIVSTPELIENYEEHFQDYIFILDEFHLFYYWGDSFRPKMINVFRNIISTQSPIILLTATLKIDLKVRASQDLGNHYCDIYHIDFGNQKLKNSPSNKLFYLKSMKNLMDLDMKVAKKGTSLIFCKYRKEVGIRAKELRDSGYKVLSCVGGEASKFVEQLNSTTSIDYIVATSVVSHGVNLPKISHIYFTYEVDNIDFYLQMVGRGGRDGSSFTIHTFNTDYFPRMDLLKGLLMIYLKSFRNKMISLLYW